MLVRDIELAGERNRGMYVLKSRGMNHSNQIREFMITSEGLRLLPVYIGPEGVLTGSMRAAQEDRERAARLARGQDMERKQRELDAKRATLEAQIAALRSELHANEGEARMARTQEEAREREITDNRTAAEKRRGGTGSSTGNGKRNRK
jgi:circadian clock protein KaiC